MTDYAQYVCACPNFLDRTSVSLQYREVKQKYEKADDRLLAGCDLLRSST